MLGFFQRVSPAQRVFQSAIEATAGMVHDPRAQALASRRGLNVVDITWEDTARTAGSCWGPNISDLTIQVQHGADSPEATCMPVIRHPNFSDFTCDLPMNSIMLRVGNERGEPLREVSLADYLGDLRRYLSRPGSWAGSTRSLLAPRDSHALVSAQACFLPVPRSGLARFNPVLFNYQSRAGAPAVLAIVATREGTSATVIDNARDGLAAGRSWGQRLFFNQAGERASFTGQRESDFRAEQAALGQAPSDDPGLNLALLIQVPLWQPEPPPFEYALSDCLAAPCCAASFGADSDVEEAVLGHGHVEGVFTEIDNLAIRRDERFPVRVTAQFYKATSNGVVSAADLDAIAASIKRTYADARTLGSLVTDGPTGRPTEHFEARPRGWWRALLGG